MISVSFTKFQQAVCSRDVAVHNTNYNKNISKCNNLIKIEDTLFLSLSNKYITKFLHSNLINKTYFPVKIIACINYSISRLGKLSTSPSTSRYSRKISIYIQKDTFSNKVK